ncbi:hypothetical protein F5Y08DRAFT_343946 [Xylaria arbuscula]|nr:hypothetical protein F5Y08DRAFT_343946 [Xylaria arbuscula]
MSTTKCMNYETLEQEMRGEDTLQGFDVLVSYNETQLNQLLTNATENDETTNINVELTSTSKNTTVKTVYTSKVTLAKPNLAFGGNNNKPEVILTFHLEGSIEKAETYVKHPEYPADLSTIVIPTGTKISLKCDLSALIGHVDPVSPNARFQPESKANGNTAVHFDTPDQDQTSAIAISVGSNPDVSVLCDPQYSDVQADILQALIDINAHFKDKGYCYYYLALVNAPAGTKNSELQPTSFGFPVSAGDSKERVDNAISMWITVKGGSGQAILPREGEFTNSFSVNNNTSMPIPIEPGVSASIIFSHGLIKSMLFQPALETQGCVVTGDESTPGMKLNFRFPTIKIHKDAVHKDTTELKSGRWVRTTKDVDAIDFDLKDYNATMTLNPGLCVEGEPIGTIEWTSPTFKIHWEYGTVTVNNSSPGSGGGITIPNTHEGTTELTYRLRGSGYWLNNKDQGTEALNFEWKMNDTFDVTAVAEEGKIEWWQDLWLKWDNQVPEDLKNFNFKVPDFSYEKSISYFLTTNLLGISIPHDVLLTGTMVESLVPASLVNLTDARVNTVTFVNKTLSDFLTTVLNCEESSMMGSLYTAASGSLEDANTKVKDILHKNGYDNLTADSLFSLLGTSTAQILAEQQPETLSIPYQELQKSVQLNISSTPPEFDLRLFGRAYEVTQGPSYATSQTLGVNPIDGTVTFGNQTVYPSLTTDTTVVLNKTTVSWLTSITSYSVVFTTTLKDDAFVASFSGTATPIGGTSEPFVGNQKIAQSEPDSWDDFSKANNVIAIVFDLLAIVAFVAAFKWRSEDKNNKEIDRRAQQIQERQTESVQRSFRILHQFHQREVLKRAAEDALTNELPWADFGQELSDTVDRVLDTKLESYELEDLEAMDNDSSKWVEVIKSGSDAVQSECKRVVISCRQPVVVEALLPWIDAGYLSNIEARDLCAEALQPEIEAKVDGLTLGDSSYVEAVARTRMLSRRDDLRQTRLNELAEQAEKLGFDSAITESELEKKVERMQAIENKLKDTTRDQDQDKELIDERESLEKDLADLEEEKRRQEKERTEQQREKTEMELKKEVDREEKKEREKKVEEALKAEGMLRR